MNTFMAAAAATLSVGTAIAAAPVVSNVQFNQTSSSRLVTISYQLDAPAIVTVDIQTNGVSIGAQNYTPMSGDVNRLVTSPSGTVYWHPDNTWPGHKISGGEVTAVVTAWATNAPPPYLVADLEFRSNLCFYACAEAIPGGVTDRKYKTTSLVMRKIPAADVTWRMGTTEFSTNTEKPHKVTFSADYYIGIYEVTIGQYMKVIGSSSNPAAYQGADAAVHPMDNRTYNQIRKSTYPNGATLHELGADDIAYKFGKYIGIDFDLPTDAQWEYACRAGEGAQLYDGTSIDNQTTVSAELGELGWYKDNSGSATHEVGLRTPNAWGLYDMYGNVWEWCLDWYSKVPYAEASEVRDPIGPTASSSADNNTRTKRGGGYASNASSCRSAYRGSDSAASTDKMGFRFVAPVALHW